MKNFSINRKFAIIFLLFFVGTNNVLFAMKVQPMHLEMQSIGNTSSSTINVENDASNSLPVELSIEKLILDVDGRPTYLPADEDWLIFPPQALIPPNGQQNFRLQWLGSPELQESQSFHLAIKQVPVEMPKDQSGIQLVYNIRALVNIAPPNAKADLEVVKVGKLNDPDSANKQTVSLLLENRSRKYAMFSDYNLSLSMFDQAGKELWSEKYSNYDVYQALGVGMVQPNSRREFKISVHLPDSEDKSGNTLRATVSESGH